MHVLTIKANDVRDIGMACLHVVNRLLHDKGLATEERMDTPSGAAYLTFNKFAPGELRPQPLGDEVVDERISAPATNPVPKARSRAKSKRQRAIGGPRQYKPKKCAKCGEMFTPRSGAARTCDKCCAPKRAYLRREAALRKLKQEENDPASGWFHGVKGLPNWPIAKIAALPDYARSKFVEHMSRKEKKELRHILGNAAVRQVKDDKIRHMADMSETLDTGTEES